MMKILQKKKRTDENKENIMNYFSLNENEIKHSMLDVYSVDFSNNEKAQDKYKERNPFGNGKIPGMYDFTKEIMIRWDDFENKPQIL
jgi:hypothetical protein